MNKDEKTRFEIDHTSFFLMQKTVCKKKITETKGQNIIYGPAKVQRAKYPAPREVALPAQFRALVQRTLNSLLALCFFAVLSADLVRAHCCFERACNA